MKNNNKMMLYKLSYKSLKASKIRNILILITIILSVSLLSFMTYFVKSVEEINEQELKLRQHVIYHNLDKEQINMVKGNEHISQSAMFKKGISFEKDNFILLPFYMEQNTPMSNINIVEGSYPTELNQVLVDKKLMDAMGLEAVIGHKITIPFLDGTTEEFEVSGYITSDSNSDIYTLYLSKQYAEVGSQLKDIPWDLSARIYDAEKMNNNKFLDTIRQIGAQYNIERKNINENNMFLDSLYTDFKEFALILIIGLSILLVSMIVIYSIFYISISERTRQYGQFRTLGITKRQIKKMISIEGAILSLIGAPIGILVGVILVYLLKPTDLNIINIISYGVIIFLANYVTVRISLAKPAKIASNISPIEASKTCGYELNKNKNMSKKLQRKLTPISLSVIASRSNRKKTRMTMLSLGIAGIVFMTGSTMIQSMNQEKYSRQGWFEYGEFVINFSNNASQVNEFGNTGVKQNNPINLELIDRIKAIDGVTNVFASKNLHLSYEYNNVSDDDVAGSFDREQADDIKHYIKNGDIDYDKMIENKEIFICSNDIAKEVYGWKFEVGDQIKLRWYNGEEYVEDIFTIVGELKNSIHNNKDLFKVVFNTGWFLMPEELLDQMMVPNFNLNNNIIISSDYQEKGMYVEEQLQAITDDNPLLVLSTLRGSIEHHLQVYNTTFFTTLGVSLFVMAFSLINLLNTLISNIISRKREFATLQTIGMSEKQINTMIQGEGLYLVIVNIVITGILGSFCGFTLVKVMAYAGLNFMEYKFPLIYFIVYIIIVILAPILITTTIIRILRKKSLVDRIREVE